MDSNQTAPIGAVCSGSRLFASKHNLSVMLGNYFQQTTSADNIFQMLFFLGALRVKCLLIPSLPAFSKRCLVLSDFINLTQVHNFTVSAQDIFTFRRLSVFTVSFTGILQVLMQKM